MDLINFINQGWVGILVGSVLSIFFYRKSISVALPVYQYKSSRLLRRDNPNVPDKVIILFDGKEVTRLTKTFIILWNRGRKTIDGADIVRKICVIVENGETILDAKIVKCTREENNFRIEIDKDITNTANISFDYLDAGDGAVIEILHTSKSLKFDLLGTIKQVPKGIQNYGVVQSRRSKKYSIAREIVPYIFLLISSWYTSVSIGSISFLPDFAKKILVGFFVITAILSSLSVFVFIIDKNNKFPKELSYDEIV